ncbi:hypothetical protein Tco_0578580 [Tanacetum coccineum]
MYVEYLKDFLFTVEVDDATKDITFSLSLFENQLTFTRFDFLSAIGLADSNIVVPLPPKGTVRAGLATLGLTDKDKPFLSSIELVNSSPLKIKYFSPIWKIFMQYIVKCLGGMQRSHNQMNLSQQTIAYCLIFGLEINIGEIIFNDMIYKIQNRKKTKERNICYTRFISLVLEQILGDNYQDKSLTVLKPHHISAASFQIPSASEVSLTSHMLKVAKLSKEPEESLILPSEEVNAEATADKSQSRTNVQPLSQPKAPTAKKPRKEKIPSSTQPKVLDKIVEEKEIAEDHPLVISTDDVDLDVGTNIYFMSSGPTDMTLDNVDSMPTLISNSLRAQLPGLLADALKDSESIPSSKLLVENQGEQPAEVARTNEGKELVVHKPEEKKLKGAILVEDDSDEDDLDKQPLSKRFKIETPFPNIENPIPLSSFIPEHLLNPEEKSLQDFTDQLFKITSSKFSPTPPRDSFKGGSNLKLPKIKPFITPEGPLSQEKINEQLRELKRLADLKAEQDKSKRELRKMFNQATLKAHA